MIDVLKIIKPPGAKEVLCRPISQQETPEIFFVKEFPPQEITVALRPLCLATDIEPVFQWMNHEFAKSTWQPGHGPLRQLQQTFELILCSDFAQSLVALVNGEPVCQLDIYRAAQHDISLLYDVKVGDYNISILFSPDYKKDVTRAACVLQAFKDYFFRCEGIKRIIADPDADDFIVNDLLENMGFQLKKKTYMSYKLANLYVCTKMGY